MKLNQDKCHFIICGHKYEQTWIEIGNNKIWETNTVKLLGVDIDSKITLNEYVSSICKKVGNKIIITYRLLNILTLQQRRKIMKAFIDSQFNYCPLVWMCHSRTLNTRINKLQERALRIVYRDDNSTYQELLQKDNTVTVHQNRIHRLAIEMYKIINNISPKIITDLFQIKENTYNLRSENCFQINFPKTVTYGTESIRNLGVNIWNSKHYNNLK